MRFIEITKEDIEQGIPGDPYHCPIARALLREFPRAKSVTVKPFKISFYDAEVDDIDIGKKIGMFWTSQRMRDFIFQYDKDVNCASPEFFLFDDEPVVGQVP